MQMQARHSGCLCSALGNHHRESDDFPTPSEKKRYRKRKNWSSTSGNEMPGSKNWSNLKVSVFYAIYSHYFIKSPRQLYTPSIFNCNWCDIHVVSLTAAGNSQPSHNPILLKAPHWHVNLSHHHPLDMTHRLLHFHPVFTAGMLFCMSKLFKWTQACTRFSELTLERSNMWQSVLHGKQRSCLK